MEAAGVFTTGVLAHYCGVEEVLRILRGYDLSALGSAEEIEARVRELLATSRAMVESAAGRDFRWHPGETIRLDGRGQSWLQLTEAGVHLPTYVRGVWVEGQRVPETAYVAYPETGLLRLKPASGWARFPVGVQNVTVELDWGFAEPPAEIAFTQAKLTAAALLAEVGGEAGAVRETRIGDYAVRYAAEGRYASVIAQLSAEAQETLRRYRGVHVSAI